MKEALSSYNDDDDELSYTVWITIYVLEVEGWSSVTLAQTCGAHDHASTRTD